MVGKLQKHDEKIMRKKIQLELLLECRQYELSICKPDSWLFKAIQKDIDYLKQRLSALKTE